MKVEDPPKSHKATTTADKFVVSLRSIIDEARVQGVTSYHALADYLTARGIPTANGHGVWDHKAAGSLLRRLKLMDAPK